MGRTIENIKRYIEEFERDEKKIIQAGKDMFTAYKYVYYFDTFCVAQLKRSLCLISGFRSLVEQDNFICAFPLVRVHLDTLLRIFAIDRIGDNIDQITMEILNGKNLRDFKDSATKKRLTDTFLYSELTKIDGYKWVKDVYMAGNGFIHFSDQHIMSSVVIDPRTGGVEGAITRNSPYIPEIEKEGACDAMLKITEGILQFIYSWIEVKRSYNNEPVLDPDPPLS